MQQETDAGEPPHPRSQCWSVCLCHLVVKVCCSHHVRSSSLVNIEIGGGGTVLQSVVAIYLPPTVNESPSDVSLLRPEVWRLRHLCCYSIAKGQRFCRKKRKSQQPGALTDSLAAASLAVAVHPEIGPTDSGQGGPLASSSCLRFASAWPSVPVTT